MPSCVSEGSFNVLFICAVAVIVLFLLSSAYFYDKFGKAETNRLTDKDSRMGRNMAMLAMIISIIGLVLLFILYFGFQKRLVGVQVAGIPEFAASPVIA